MRWGELKGREARLPGSPMPCLAGACFCQVDRLGFDELRPEFMRSLDVLKVRGRAGERRAGERPALPFPALLTEGVSKQPNSRPQFTTIYLRLPHACTRSGPAVRCAEAEDAARPRVQRRHLRRPCVGVRGRHERRRRADHL